SLVAILDADKEGYLRSEGALIQTMGRAARHLNGHIVMYADTMTGSMQRAIDETYRRRKYQQAYNEQHGILPWAPQKPLRDLPARAKAVAEEQVEYQVGGDLPKDELARLIKDLERQMKERVKELDYEGAIPLRDQITELKKLLALKEPSAIR